MSAGGIRSIFNVGVTLKVPIVGILGYLSFLFYQENAVGSAWASLNAAVAHHQDDPKPLSPVIVKGARWSSYVLLGWPSQGRAHQYEWIILDSTPGGSVMKTPTDGQFILTCSYLADLETKVTVDRAVHRFLAARCSKN
jgi:hypothetical protein